MDETCSKPGRYKKCIRNFGREASEANPTWET